MPITRRDKAAPHDKTTCLRMVAALRAERVMVRPDPPFWQGSPVSGARRINVRHWFFFRNSPTPPRRMSFRFVDQVPQRLDGGSDAKPDQGADQDQDQVARLLAVDVAPGDMHLLVRGQRASGFEAADFLVLIAAVK